jgi:hypothetical protein
MVGPPRSENRRIQLHYLNLCRHRPLPWALNSRRNRAAASIRPLSRRPARFARAFSGSATTWRGDSSRFRANDRHDARCSRLCAADNDGHPPPPEIKAKVHNHLSPESTRPRLTRTFIDKYLKLGTPKDNLVWPSDPHPQNPADKTLGHPANAMTCTVCMGAPETPSCPCEAAFWANPALLPDPELLTYDLGQRLGVSPVIRLASTAL